MNINENIDVLFEKFEAFIKSQTIVGQEIKIGDVTIIPLASISFSLGSGGGSGSDNKGDGGEGGGAGIAAKATPTALLVINGENVNMMPIRKGNSFESLLESIPSLVEKIKSYKPDEKKSTDDTGEEE